LKEFRTVKAALNNSGNKNILVLDEGGLVHAEITSEMASRTAGVEQTTFGNRDQWKYPTVLVCRSAAKKLFESQIIARGILRKLYSLDILQEKFIGVIGLGALGSELTRTLMSRGFKILACDEVSSPADLREINVSLPILLERCEIILGCTGKDVFQNFSWKFCTGNKIFISCSSGQIEFWSLIRECKKFMPYASVVGEKENVQFIILNGGYPINFDRKREWEIFGEIVLTRRLVLEGLEQASKLYNKKLIGYMLNPNSQLRIVNEWLEQVPERSQLRVPNVLDEKFLLAHSEGFLSIGEKPYVLHDTTPAALASMRQHGEKYTVDVLNFQIVLLPNVWSPAYDWSSAFHLENLPDLTGRDFLEIGCGSGVISVGASRKGARKIVAVDINPAAVKNTQMNFAAHCIKNAQAFISDVFSDIDEQFDVVTWNAPYHGSKPTDMLERGCADENYISLKKFIKGAKNHLKPGGLIVLGFSESGDTNLLEQLIFNNQLRIKRKLSDWRHNYNCLLYEIVVDKRHTSI
jgi:2-polyprenyl-3-methyl-5-hydroxy-6-metoxy-1,4-benzoquinol methylase